MGRYNVNFELSVEDMELIEDALRKTKSDLSGSVLDAANDNGAAQPTSDQMRRIHELLGRLHNQKVFYRPKTKAYVGG